MTWFSARNISLSTVPVNSSVVWDLITDPDTLAALTPLIRSIHADGPRWTWTLNGIEALGLKVEAEFTERMTFTEHEQIVFTHDPPPEARERTGVDGTYDLTPAGDDGTDLRVDLTLSVDLPLPRMARLAVETVLNSTMSATGQRFATNLYEHLGLDPSTVAITELSS